jgi:glycosyltransferase involved in cell wall biosynthesis
MKVPAGSRLFIYLHNDLLNNQTRDHQKIYDAADHILTVSNYIASRVRTINPDDKKCIPILNGIDNKAFSPDITSNVTRQQLGFNDNDFIMVFSGRITKEKGVSELIDAMISLNSHPNIKLLIIGSPFYGDTENEDDFVRQLKQKASTIQERIRFTGFIAYAQMPSYLKISDIAVIPSLWDDPCPNTVLEAQAMGLPIITTRRGGIPEEVNEEGAILLPTDNHFTNRLAQAILSLYQNEALRQQMSAKLLTHSTYYSTERYVQDFYHALSTVHLSGKKHSE